MTANLEDQIAQAGREVPFKEETELGQVMSNLDDDRADVESGMSNIDFNTRLSSLDINNIMIIDEFVRLGILPSEIGVTRQKKRLAVSHEGKGREEKVRIVAGERERKAGGGFGERLAGLFQRRE